MAYDKIYYFDKINHRRYELGEIQTNFNLNIVIDGEKDSMQIDVHSYSRDALQPNTIIYHTDDPLQWFVVKKDNVKRNANEKGFYYIHSITLNGAIDLTKNRDLTDCGFNANGYTIDEFFKKLLKLSNFEFDYEIDYGNNVDKDKKVDYIKSYENYTLLSAIRDFFNGYNCDVKLSFETERIVGPFGYIKLKKAIFKIIPRTGNIDLPTLDISEFNDIRESINFDKESYGTTVISNAQNVVSTLSKTYPQVGGVRVTGTDYDTTWTTAYIKLPSPVWKVNWVKLICPIRIRGSVRYNGTQPTVREFAGDRHYSFEKAFQSAKDSTYYEGQPARDALDFAKDKLEKLFNKMTITFYNNPTYNPRVDLNGSYGTIVKEEQTPYIAFMDHITAEGTSDDAHQVAVMDKESAELLKSDKLALVFERGNDKITNLKSIEDMSNIYTNTCDLMGESAELIDIYTSGDYTFSFYLEWGYRGEERLYQQVVAHETCFQINYIPMSDLKVKQDNENNNNDIQLYNQNGKLNDSVALSKMVDSYSKEITNPTITRYGEYYNLNDIPQVGQIVMDGNTKYVINNISYNLYPCESDDEDEVNYYCECEFTLAEFISTKSIMTSPNTNVRDYGIPQKYNIKRRQVYRDYYEFGFSYETLANSETPYAKLENYLQLDDSATPKEFDHTALIKIYYEQEVSGQMSWYYQLNSTAYTMAKSVYEVIDFDDNNIIGYDIANTTTGFNMSDLWSNQYRAVTTPVQYVDDFGKFVGITLQMTGKDTLEQAYSQINTNNNPVMFSAHCFIDKRIYDLVANAPLFTKGKIDNHYIDGTYTENQTTEEDYLYANLVVMQKELFGLNANDDIRTIRITSIKYRKYYTEDELKTASLVSIEQGGLSDVLLLSFEDTTNTDHSYYGEPLAIWIEYEKDLVVSNTYHESIHFTIPSSDIGFECWFHASASDLGIPDNIILNSTNIVGIASKEVRVNNSPIDGAYDLSISSFDDNNRTISFHFGALKAVIGATGTLDFYVSVSYKNAGSIADYVIDEQDYNKDPIEVPVFEYSLQFGDTKEVEVGDNILKNNVGMLSFYTAVVVDKNTATPLNASKWFEGLSVSGDTYSDPNNVYDCMVEIANPNYVNFALEDDNKKLRIKFFTNNITALFYGIESTDSFSLQSIEKGSTRKPKSQLVDKDIIIYRHTIKSMTYDSSVVPDIATCDYDTELMYIIHAPQDVQFENDDLVLKLNYYRLK